MSPEELANKLSEMYNGAKEKEIATMVHLFGVTFASEIKACGVSPANLSRMAKISTNYGTEINKGINLSKYVRVK